MSKRMKVIVSVMAAVLLLAVGGTMVVMADDGPAPEPRAGMSNFLDRLAEKLGVDVQVLKDAMTQLHAERPEKDGEKWQGRRGPAGFFGNMPEDIDREALKAALTQAREEMKGQEGVDHRAVIAGVLESFGIDIEAMKATRAEARESRQAMRAERQDEWLTALAGAIGKDVQEVKDAFNELREEIKAEHPEGDCTGRRPFGHRFGGGFPTPKSE